MISLPVGPKEIVKWGVLGENIRQPLFLKVCSLESWSSLIPHEPPSGLQPQYRSVHVPVFLGAPQNSTEEYKGLWKWKGLKRITHFSFSLCFSGAGLKLEIQRKAKIFLLVKVASKKALCRMNSYMLWDCIMSRQGQIEMIMLKSGGIECVQVSFLIQVS